jgi:DNA-binding MarR family transcriptional regulator/GNAT superfamily N-acetyltransferase
MDQMTVIRDVRAFNRFYTDVIGLLDQHLLDSPYSLAEARIIYEVRHNPGIQASQIMERMPIDKSYLSRLLKKLEKDGVIKRKKSEEDARVVVISLTAKGKKEFDFLNRSSDEQIATLIQPFSSIQKENLVADMSSIKHMLTPVKPATLEKNSVSIRTQLVPGDLGYVAWLHGKVYAEECSYLLNFEGYVLESLGEWAHQYDPAKDRVWVCESTGRIIGFLAAVDHSDSLQLRYFLLLPEYRGIGLGKKLMDEFIAWMKFRGIRKSYLWTTKEQHTAIALYKRYGYKLTEEKPSQAFDKQLIEQRYDLEL